MSQSADYSEPLDRAHAHTLDWIQSLGTRHIGPTVTADELGRSIAQPLGDAPLDPAAVVDELAALAEPGLMAMPSGRFFGWVIGGTLPAALAADWMVSAWDQNAAMRYATPATAAIEETAGRWVLDILGLPVHSAVGFTTGGTMANFVGLGAARRHVLAKAGWDVNTNGLAGSPPIAVLAGAEVHVSVALSLRYLGLGQPILVDADGEGRMLPAALSEAMRGVTGPAIVVLQAGNLHSGAFDPMRECINIAREHGAWVHVDGAFGLWAAASTRYEVALDGIGLADSWATDAHKTLNVPYDCGIAIVAPADAAHDAFGARASYLIHGEGASSDPFDLVPEMSRRARGIPVWAALRSLGRSGATALVEGLADHAKNLADGLSQIPGVTVLNDVVFTQISLTFGSDERTRAVTQALIEAGTVWMSGSHWRGQDILRISVSNWSTDAADVATAIAAVEHAMKAVAPA